MDELISLALNALAEKNAQNQGRPAAEGAAAERHRRMLQELRDRAAVHIGGAVPPRPPSPTIAPTPPPRMPPPETAAISSPPAPAPAPERGPLLGLFEGSSNVLRAVVAAELLDRPLAMRENAPWQKR